MIDWYLQTVYILPWWVYAAPIYFLIATFWWRIEQLTSRRPSDALFLVLVWPFSLVAIAFIKVMWLEWWLLGFTDDLPPITEKLIN